LHNIHLYGWRMANVTIGYFGLPAIVALLSVSFGKRVW
jgi:hypothetical protein